MRDLLSNSGTILKWWGYFFPVSLAYKECHFMSKEQSLNWQ